jgi:cytochrome P450
VAIQVATPTVASAPGRRRIADLPGPRRWPLLGNLPQMRMSRIHRDIEEWGRRYGPVFRVELGWATMLVVTDHETIAEVLGNRPDGFRRTSRLRAVGEELGSTPGVSSTEGDVWRRQRRMVMASFAVANVRDYFPRLVAVTRRLEARWRRAARDGRAVDLQADLKCFTMDAIAGLAFGAEFRNLETQDSELLGHLDTILTGVYRRMVSPLRYWRVLRLPADRRLERSMAALQATIAGIVAAARERLRRDPALRQRPASLVEAMIVAADGGESGLTDADVSGNVSTMLFAGEESTAKTLAWLIYLLHRNPLALTLAREEVLRVAPDSAAFTLEQVAALDYVEACINEAMRLKPVLPFNAVEALHDTTVAGVEVPAGTMVWCVMRHDSVDERYFPDAGTFEPERWLDRARSAPAAARRVSMAFGSGPRTCPGRHLAMMEIKLAIAMLLGAFEMQSLEPRGGAEAREVMAFMMQPERLCMRLRERR